MFCLSTALLNTLFLTGIYWQLLNEARVFAMTHQAERQEEVTLNLLGQQNDGILLLNSEKVFKTKD
jgi:hypothetical protein